jgi:hypothetical protein
VPFALEDDVARAISARYLDHQSLRLAREAVTETGIANLDTVQIPRAEEVTSCLIGGSLRGPRIVYKRTERLHQFVDIARRVENGISPSVPHRLSVGNQRKQAGPVVESPCADAHAYFSFGCHELWHDRDWIRATQATGRLSGAICLAAE